MEVFKCVCVQCAEVGRYLSLISLVISVSKDIQIIKTHKNTHKEYILTIAECQQAHLFNCKEYINLGEVECYGFHKLLVPLHFIL